MNINKFFILASDSESRKSILKKLNLNFKTTRHKCNESFYKKKFIRLGLSPKKISLELAKKKAESVKIKNKLIIGSDTVISFKGKIIDKAKSKIEATEKIKKLSGKKHIIISSVVAYYNRKMIWCCNDSTVVKIRKLNDLEIKEYLKLCGQDILRAVGCYQIEKKGPIIIEEIKGDFFNVMGFPLFMFLKLLNNKNPINLNEK